MRQALHGRCGPGDAALTGDFRDRWHRRARTVLHPVDRYRPWFRELARYYRHLSWFEFWLRFHEGRTHAKGLWAQGVPAWDRTDYYLLRQSLYHRDKCWHTVAALLPQGGRLLEYGCGIAPVAAWMHTHRPDVDLWLYDLASRTREFAQWRLPKAGWTDGQPRPENDVVVCLEVLEHCDLPVNTMRWLIGGLKPGAYLYLDFVGEVGDGGGGSRDAALKLLDDLECLQPLTAEGGRGLYRKSEVRG